MIGTGESLALLSGFCYAAANVSIAKSAKREGTDNGALLSIVATAALALGIWAASGALLGFGTRYDDAAGIGWFVLSGLLTIVLGRALFFVSVARVGAIRASAVSRLNPFFSVLLAATVLGEVITPTGAAGMAMIALSFVCLTGNAFLRKRDISKAATAHVPATAYGFGAASALAYAIGYTARKFGIEELPDPYFGTFVGAVTGLVAYAMIAIFSERHRRNVSNLVCGTTRWHALAAGCISLGQVAQFAAISYIEVSRVIMITSADILFSLVLSVYVLKTEARPDAATLLAAAIASVGVVMITLA